MPLKCVHLKWYENFTYLVVTYTELFFYKLGVAVGSKPLRTIAACWLLVALSTLGFFRFHQEKNPMKLWIPPHTTFLEDSKWLMDRYQNGYRVEAAIAKAPDVLSPEVIKEFFDLHERIRGAVTDSGIAWPNVCFKIPEIGLGMGSSLTKSYKKGVKTKDPSVDMDSETYCSFVDSMGTECLETSIFELWNYNGDKINKLTKDDIVDKINRFQENPLMDKFKNYVNLLGGVERNATGHIVKAESLQNLWMVTVNFSAVDMDKSGNLAGTADWISPEGMAWEGEFVKIMENFTKSAENFHLFFISARSFGDVSNATMFQDIHMLVIGIFMMVIYVQFVISKFNWLEARIVLSCLGLLSVGMSFIVACGLCSALGVSYGPVHTSLPFLLMGLGVDDMFVLMACWDDLTEEQKRLPLHERVGLMLKHGGVSITVTSVTDILAFIVGSSTILPSLESFCIYAAVGVFMIFVFAITFFTACFTIDQKRVESSRNGVIPCYIHSNYVPNECSQQQFSNRMFHYFYSNVVFSTPGKIVVVLITVGCAAFGIKGMLALEQKFDPLWFIPEDSYFLKYIQERTKYYPTMGFEAGLYMGELDYNLELERIHDAVELLRNNTDIVNDISSWVQPFHDFVYEHFKKDIYEEKLSDSDFRLLLSKFLFSPFSAKYQANFKFDKPLKCGKPVPNITMSSIDFRFRYLNNKKIYLPAMHKVVDIAKNANFTTGDRFATSWSKMFAWWITDEVIDIEVMRNLQLALLCVMGSTIILIANVQICFWVFVCVLLTMVNVCGFMQQWGLTIDLVTCIGLELAIGLCVDYATHIGHTFLTIEEGNRTDRALKTVSSIGAAVVYGGLSTFLGMSLLGLSDAYTFRTFFKIFLLVIVFGLFHGVVLLPVILSWIGPKSYRSHKQVPQSDLVVSHIDPTNKYLPQSDNNLELK